MAEYPAALSELIAFFESLPEGERRENLIDLATQAAKHAPKEGEAFDLEDVRKDAECTDTVGVHVRLEQDGGVHFAVSLGPKVQTLTRALTVILCRGLNGSTTQAVWTFRRILCRASSARSWCGCVARRCIMCSTA
jgi:cysteine desulfuration protein SufE